LSQSIKTISSADLTLSADRFPKDLLVGVTTESTAATSSLLVESTSFGSFVADPSEL
jgi:hypothetical protein